MAASQFFCLLCEQLCNDTFIYALNDHDDQFRVQNREVRI